MMMTIASIRDESNPLSAYLYARASGDAHSSSSPVTGCVRQSPTNWGEDEGSVGSDAG